LFIFAKIGAENAYPKKKNSFWLRKLNESNSAILTFDPAAQ